MELHEQFMKIAGSESSIFKTLEDSCIVHDSIDSILIKSIEDCFNKLKTSPAKQHLELMRLLLCQLYKLNYKHGRNNKTKLAAKFNEFAEIFTIEKLSISKGDKIVVYDILILHLVLFENQNNLINLFEDFKTFVTLSQSKNKLSTDFHLNVLNCFLESWEILYFLSFNEDLNPVNKTHLESCKKVLVSSILYDLQTFVLHKETIEWHSFYCILRKIIDITKSTKILSSFIHEIPLENNSTLTVLCILCDLIFPVDSSKLDVDYNLILNSDLWFLLHTKLVHAQSPERKQALYFFKKTVDFISKNTSEIKKAKLSMLSECKINPFICDLVGSKSTLSIKDLLVSFILIMEALEEKQKHLVIPSLSLLSDLEKGWVEHKQCGNCFDLTWLLCVYTKILHHDNNSVIKWGLLRLLQFDFMEENTYNFIKLIVVSLNNTFLYEKSINESDPEISLALRQWFIYNQREDQDSIERFVFLSSQVPWGPVPMYYTLKSLLSASNELENSTKWTIETLDSIRFLMESSIKLYPPKLRSTCQVMLIKILSRFCEIEDLSVMANLLHVFLEQDIQEPSCWLSLTTWMYKIPHNVSIDFIRKTCLELRLNDANERISMSVFALIIQLLYEGQVICQTKHCPATLELRALLLHLSNVDVRPYVDTSFIIKILDLIYHLLHLQRPVPDFILQYFISYKETVYRFILKLLNNDNVTYKQSRVCLRALENINYRSGGKNSTILIVTGDNKVELEDKCIRVLNNANKHNEVQLSLAVQLWSDHSDLFTYKSKFFHVIVNELLQIPKSKNLGGELTGKIGQDYYVALSRFIRNHVLALNIAEFNEIDDWLDILSEILDASGNQVLIHFSDVMRLYSTFVRNDNDKLETFNFLIKSFWNCNFASKRDKIFWMVNQRLTACVNSSNFLSCKTLRVTSKEFISRMLSEADSLPVLKYILLTCSEIEGNFNHFTEVVLNGLLHGQVLRRDQRISMQACTVGDDSEHLHDFKYEKLKNVEVHDFINRQSNVDAAVRAAAVLQLCNALRERAANADLFLPLVLEKLLPLKKKRYFADSQLHRIKHRIFQVLLILQPNLNEESTKILYENLCDSFVEDTDQHSIRLMKEWLLVRIYLSNENLLVNLWEFFDKIYNERPGSASSMIGIIWHVAQLLNKEQLQKFIRTALSKLGICGMGQQFGMRFFGQVFFVKLYELLDKDCDIRLEYSCFYKAILESLNNGSFKKNPMRIDEDFFYTVFNPLEHYSLETIYHQLPRLTNVSFEEWVTKKIFEEQMLLDNLKVDFNVTNSDNLLNQATIPYAILKSNERSKAEEIESSGTTTDMQKKIIPWKIMLPNDEELQELASLLSLKNGIKSPQNMIVVASLIDKPQNLGGIARTCEIFAVKELVVSNCKQTEEKDFQALSVSADKWLRIIEVKSFLLNKYLLELKNSGWTLIGAEQTANSVNLVDVKFPKKTALILGNEKNGIPANIIPLLDICLEIPQFGIIRSLNVHVTSAICIWEYVKQHQLLT